MAPDKSLRVDANGGYTLEQARRVCGVLADLGVGYMEQPLAMGNLEELRILKKEAPLPIYVDEDSKMAADLPRLAGIVDGINIKLMKTGGLTEARRMIALAQVFGFKVMLGCMIETSVAITAAANLAPYADDLDLDGNLLTCNDPFAGVTYDADGAMHLPHEPGLGLKVRPGCEAAFE
jgi:L-alanine-DL-glutamate epimerase-like enolase superfamily enzyme